MIDQDIPTTLDAWQRAFDAHPEEWHQPGVCRFCSAALPLPHIIESETGAFSMAVTSCEPCIATHRAQYEQSQLDQKHTALTRFCPPDFACEWDSGSGNNALLAEAKRHFSVTNKRGLLLHGPSGQCKTRVAWEIIKGLEANSPFPEFKWLFVDSFEVSANGFPKDAASVPLLVLDDAGNDVTTNKAEAGLLHLLKRRCDYHRPTIITTQLTGAQFKARFFAGAAGAALLRRMMQRCTAIAA